MSGYTFFEALYFQQNGVQLVVAPAIPEPAATALIAGWVLFGFAAFYRRSSARCAT